MKPILLLALTLLSSGHPLAADATSAGFKQSLGGVPAAEMPAKAAQLVSATKSRNRATVAAEVLKAGLALNPDLAATLVSAIVKAAPDTAVTVAATAAAQQPRLAAEIARAAAAAAPNQAGKIVAALCRVVPADYQRIAIYVAQVAPDATKEILRAVGSAIPELKPGIAAALATFSNRPPSVAAVLDSPALAETTSPALATQPRGPVLTPPYVPYSGSSSGITPTDTALVPRGGRNYAAP